MNELPENIHNNSEIHCIYNVIQKNITPNQDE